VGSVLGPTLGGYLGASGDYYFGAKLAVVGSLISIVLTLFMPNKLDVKKEVKEKLNESTDINIGQQQENEKKNSEVPSFFAVIQIVWLYLSTKVISSVANAMAATVFPIVLKNQYHVDEKGLGLAMSLTSASNALVSGFFLEPIVKFLGEDLSSVISRCLIWMGILSAVQGMSVMTVVTDFTAGGGLYQYIGIGLLITVFQYVLSTTITGESTSKVGPNAKGTLLGLEHALFAAARIASPQLGLAILSSAGISTVCYSCAAIFVCFILPVRSPV
jgi:hypothetical protein